MTTLVFDIETNGFLDELTTIHSLVIKNVDTGEVHSFAGADNPTYGPVSNGLALLAEADIIVGHNVIGFDIPAIQKVYPNWKPKGVVRDTLILTRLLWPKEAVEEIDFARAAKDLHPKNMIGVFTLEAWGHRLGNYKGDFKGPWDSWTPAMQDYCEQDVEVTTTLWRKCLEKIAGSDDGVEWWAECVELEHEVAWIVARQERFGFSFDVEKAGKLYAKLAARRAELEAELRLAFPPRVVETVSKATNKKYGYVKGQVRRKVIPFNPGSRKQVAARLVELGWKPDEFNKDGSPKVDDAILEALPYPQAKTLAEYFIVKKRLGALAEGKEAWLKLERNGRIHGRVVTNGAVTGRMTHAKPNTANVDKDPECRALFRATPGRKLIGCDADALELRCLAHYMARYDGGAYVQTVLSGKKSDGTDMHSVNARALGLDRDTAKTWFYAFIYGAGDWKLGFTITGKKGPRNKIARIGKEARDRFLSGLPAMGKLVGAVKAVLKGKRKKDGTVVVKPRKWVRGLDGRKVYIRSEHAALNTLLQSAGAIIMKKAQVILDKNLQARGYVPGVDYEFVAVVHDEWQIEVDPKHIYEITNDKGETELRSEIGELAADSIRLAGEHFNFKCPLKGNYDIGNTWADTH